jgi:hypothetical protein
MPRTSPRLVLVAGIGRSGTSLLTGVLGRLGLHIPTPEVAADPTNPTGFSEPQWVVDFHTTLLRERGMTVLDSRPQAWDLARTAAADPEQVGLLRRWLEVQLVGDRPVAVKDPRTVWFLDLWQQVAADLDVSTGYVTMLRSPAEVVASARASYGSWQTDASRACAWLNVTLATEQALRDQPRAFVRYADLVADWRHELRRVGEALELAVLTQATKEEQPAIDELVEPTLARADRDWSTSDVPDGVQRLCESTWTAVQELVAPGGDAATVHGELDRLQAAYRQLYADAEAIAQSSMTAATKATKSAKPKKKDAAAKQGAAAKQQPRRNLLRRAPAALRRRISPARRRQRLRRSQ